MCSCSMLPAAAARQRRCRTFTPAEPANKGQRYAADPPTVDEIIAIMRVARQPRTAIA